MPLITGRHLGLDVGIDAPQVVLDRVALRLPPGWAPSDAVPLRVWEVEVLPQESQAEWTAMEVMGAVELWCAEHTTEAVAVHAGVVASRGLALVVPGRSMQGKSTLTMALLEQGASFLSDEYALLHPDGSVTPYPRPVSVRSRDRRNDTIPERVDVTTLGHTVQAGPVPVGAVAFVSYDPDAGLSLQEMGSGATTLALLDNAVAAQTQKETVMRTCAAVAGRARGWSGTRGEADEAATALLELLSRR